MATEITILRNEIMRIERMIQFSEGQIALIKIGKKIASKKGKPVITDMSFFERRKSSKTIDTIASRIRQLRMEQDEIEKKLVHIGGKVIKPVHQKIISPKDFLLTNKSNS